MRQSRLPFAPSEWSSQSTGRRFVGCKGEAARLFGAVSMEGEFSGRGAGGSGDSNLDVAGFAANNQKRSGWFGFGHRANRQERVTVRASLGERFALAAVTGVGEEFAAPLALEGHSDIPAALHSADELHRALRSCLVCLPRFRC